MIGRRSRSGAESAAAAAGASRGPVLQAALGTLVLLVLVFAWLSLSDAEPARSVVPAAPPGDTAAAVAPSAVPPAPAPLVTAESATPPAETASPASNAAATPAEAPAAPPEATPSSTAAAPPTPAAPPVAAAPEPTAAVAAPPAPPAAPAAPEPPAKVAGADATPKTPPPVCAPAAEPPQAAGRRFPPAPPSNGFMVQVGVFVDSEKAETLRRELARRGQTAYLQSRVLLGPFPDRKAAQQAEEKIRRERKLDGMILPPHKAGQ